MTSDSRFGWTRFYEEFADRLLAYRHNRGPLVEAVHEICDSVGWTYLQKDQFPDGQEGTIRDLCPFTTIGAFNRTPSGDKRRRVARHIGDFLGVSEAVPDSFDGIPVLRPDKSWFFGFAKDRGNDIDVLWQVFTTALELADSGSESVRLSFVDLYGRALSVKGVLRNLTMGLFWIRPHKFPTLDNKSVGYITDRLQLTLPSNKLPSGSDYLSLADNLQERFSAPSFPVHSFQQLALAAYDPEYVPPPPEPPIVPPIPEYTIDNISDDGCFLEQAKLETILNRLRVKKNLILQGPPGTGKTWLAKKLAYALIEQRDDRCVRRFQFHPNMSYEDFVRGYRPDGSGGLTLLDGPFLKTVFDARRDQSNDYVMVIEEINRGNPAQIFGEMLTLLESDKRDPDEALALSYPRSNDERVHIPPNMYVIPFQADVGMKELVGV